MLLNNKKDQRKIFLNVKVAFFLPIIIKFMPTLSYFQLHFYLLTLYESFASIQVCIHKWLYVHRKERCGY